MLTSRFAGLASGFFPFCALAWDGATLPMPPVPLRQVVETARDAGLVPGGAALLPNGLSLHLAVPKDDACSPSGAWLICPGMRLASQGDEPSDPLVAIWWTRLLPHAAPLASLRASAIARLGPPKEEATETETHWGLELTLHRLAWHMPGVPTPPLLLEVRYVLDDRIPGAPPMVTRLAWSAVPPGASSP